MFKRSRRKIVAAILSALVLLLFGTLCVIYIASYAEMTRDNGKMLEQYVDSYTLSGPSVPGETDRNMRMRTDGGRLHQDPPMLELSTFYSVAVSEGGQVLAVDTADNSAIDNEALTELAGEIMDSGRKEGIRGSLIYRMADKGDYTLVAFLDNTVMQESAGTLISYTLLFGSVSLVLMFFLARFLADRIVRPLEESYRKQKQFVSDAGHELKTPVAVMNANLELLAREMGENRWLSNIQYENGRMSALVTQLLDLARAENTTPLMESVDLGRITAGETLPFETVAFEKGLVLNSSISENIYVTGNRIQLAQLISVLVDNAIRHSDRGKEVTITLEKEKKSALLSVVNDGEEIPEEQRKHLFERFYRIDSVRNGEDGHYGLGLSIAKAITVSHRGTIEVSCYDGKVEFTVKIPLGKQN